MSDLVTKAREFALEAHKLQKYGDKPYSYHLDNVVHFLNSFKIEDEVILASGYLHDTIEDVEDVTKETILEKFGEEVSDIVYAVTDEPGENRKERKAKTYPKIRANEKAIIVKLADRIANVSASKGTSLMKMYFKEHDDFKSKLMRPQNEISPVEYNMWNYLEGLMNS